MVPLPVVLPPEVLPPVVPVPVVPVPVVAPLPPVAGPVVGLEPEPSLQCNTANAMVPRIAVVKNFILLSVRARPTTILGPWGAAAGAVL